MKGFRDAPTIGADEELWWVMPNSEPVDGEFIPADPEKGTPARIGAGDWVVLKRGVTFVGCVVGSA